MLIAKLNALIVFKTMGNMNYLFFLLSLVVRNEVFLLKGYHRYKNDNFSKSVI